jgi:hypothetical protein
MSNSKTEIEMPKTLGQASRLSKERVSWNLDQKILSKKSTTVLSVMLFSMDLE